MKYRIQYLHNDADSQKVPAIRAIRKFAGLNLRDAKDITDGVKFGPYTADLIEPRMPTESASSGTVALFFSEMASAGYSVAKLPDSEDYIVRIAQIAKDAIDAGDIDVARRILDAMDSIR